jgi:hypothetical protein
MGVMSKSTMTVAKQQELKPAGEDEQAGFKGLERWVPLKEFWEKNSQEIHTRNNIFQKTGIIAFVTSSMLSRRGRKETVIEIYIRKGGE